MSKKQQSSDTKRKELEAEAKINEKASEELAKPVLPAGVGAQIKVVAKDSFKDPKQKEKFLEHIINIALIVALAWSISKLVQFYYPDSPWIIWIKYIDTFLPILLITAALYFRIKAYLLMRLAKKKNIIKKT